MSYRLYSTNTFTGLTDSGVITITYTTTDSRNNTTEKQAKVTIVDTNATKEGPMDFDGKKQYARFIAAAYYQKDDSSGGLEAIISKSVKEERRQYDKHTIMPEGSTLTWNPMQ